MLINLIAVLLLFLPWFEGDLKTYGYILLFTVSGIVGYYFKDGIKFDRYDYLFLIFLIFASVSTVLTSGKSRSFLELLKYISYFLIFISIRHQDIINLTKIKSVYIFAILINSALLCLVSISFIFHKPLLPNPTSGMNLYFALFGHNNLVSLLLFALPITYILISKFNNNLDNKHKKLFISLFVFYSFSFLFTFSKAGYLVIIFVFLLMINTLRKNLGIMQPKNKILLLLIFPAVLFFIFIVINTYFLKIHERPSYSQINKPLYLDWRWDYYTIALRGIYKSPIFGVGLDNFRYLSRLYQSKPLSWSDYGENYYLTFVSEVGIIGGLIMFILLFSIFRKLFIKVTGGYNLVDIGIYFALAGSALHVIFSDDWYFLSIFLYFWVGVAIILPNVNKFHEINRRKNYLLQILSILLIVISLFYSLGKLSYHLANKYKSDYLFRIASLSNFFDYQTQLDIGIYNKFKNDFNNALFYFDRAKRLEPLDVVSYIAEGDMLDQQGDTQNSINDYAKVIKLNPQDYIGFRYTIYRIYFKNVAKFILGEKYQQALNLIYAVKDTFPDYFSKDDRDKYFQQTKYEINKRNKKEIISKMNNLVKRAVKLGTNYNFK